MADDRIVDDFFIRHCQGPNARRELQALIDQAGEEMAERIRELEAELRHEQANAPPPGWQDEIAVLSHKVKRLRKEIVNSPCPIPSSDCLYDSKFCICWKRTALTPEKADD